jgi:hypothetical protein
MVSLFSLAVPIVVSAVLVFVASSFMHMVLTYHRHDYRKLPKEDEVMGALRGFSLPPGDYMLPCAGSSAAARDPAFLEKMSKGPVAIMTVVPSGPPAMGTSLTLWFVYAIVVNTFAGYIASRAVGPGTDYLEVFRFVSTAAFMGYSLALAQFSIWYRRNWGTTVRSMLDGLVYGLLTAGVFGWLWPR